MTPFYFSEIDGNKITLRDEEAKHILQVMRHRTGEKIIGVDGNGNMYEARIVSKGKKTLELEVLNITREWGEHSYSVRLYAGLLHKADRFEWLVEKVTELGVTEIYPFISKNTVKTGFRMERMERITVAAMKQCMRSRLPVIHEPVSLEDIFDHEIPGLKLIASAPEGNTEFNWAKETGSVKEVSVMIGPEGDFTPEELRRATDSGWKAVRLGENRLRTETAAIHITSIVKHYLGY